MEYGLMKYSLLLLKSWYQLPIFLILGIYASQVKCYEGNTPGNHAIDARTGKIITVLPKPKTLPTASYNYKPLNLTTLPPAKELATGAEILVVSGYSASYDINVHVDRPNSKVILVLTSYENASWKVSVSPKTQLVAVITSSNHETSVASTVPTRGYLTKLSYATRIENSNFVKILESLHDWFGTTKVDFFRGDSYIPSSISILEPDPFNQSLTLNGPTPQKPSRNFMFKLTTANFKRQPWFLTGSVGQPDSYSSSTKAVVSPSGKEVYTIKNSNLVVLDPLTSIEIQVKLPSSFPELSWPMDVAYDTNRDIVSLASLGGEGFLYRLDASKKQWLDFKSLNNVDMNALAYDPIKDRYVALQEGKLLFISPEGLILFEKDISKKLAGLKRLYDDGNERPPRLIIAPNGDDLALVYINKYEVKRIWWYNVITDLAVLTYSR